MHGLLKYISKQSALTCIIYITHKSYISTLSNIYSTSITLNIQKTSNFSSLFQTNIYQQINIYI